MRRVDQGSIQWRSPGVGSAEVAALVGCAAGRDDGPLVFWAMVVQRRERQEINRMRKEQLVQGSEYWLNWRKKGVGGSEVACVVGANPYRDSQADRIWQRKLPADHPNALPEVSDNPAMAHGRKHEPEARRIYESLFGWTAQDVCVLHDEHDYIRCSLDGLRPDDRLVLEIKCPGEKNHQKYLDISKYYDSYDRQTAFARAFPYYRMQVLYQLAITGAEVCHFVSYRPDWGNELDRLVVIPLYPEPDEQRRLLERVTEFWGFVERREPPPKEWMLPCWRLPEALTIPVKTTSANLTTVQ